MKLLIATAVTVLTVTVFSDFALSTDFYDNMEGPFDFWLNAMRIIHELEHFENLTDANATTSYNFTNAFTDAMDSLADAQSVKSRLDRQVLDIPIGHLYDRLMGQRALIQLHKSTQYLERATALITCYRAEICERKQHQHSKVITNWLEASHDRALIVRIKTLDSTIGTILSNVTSSSTITGTTEAIKMDIENRLASLTIATQTLLIDFESVYDRQLAALAFPLDINSVNANGLSLADRLDAECQLAWFHTVVSTVHDFQRLLNDVLLLV